MDAWLGLGSDTADLDKTETHHHKLLCSFSLLVASRSQTQWVPQFAPKHCMCVRESVCECVCVSLRERECVCVCESQERVADFAIYIYTYMHTHTHTHTHTRSDKHAT